MAHTEDAFGGWTMRWAFLTAMLVVLAVSIIAPSQVHAAQGRAFVVGIDSYPNLSSDRQLQKAISDARTMGGVLRGLGYDVTRIEDVTRSRFYQEWDAFLRTIEPGDTAVLFFSGHGVELNGTNYLIPSDIRTLSAEQEVRFKSEVIRFEELQANLHARNAGLSLLIIDACRDNPFASGTKSLGGRRGLAPVQPVEGTFVMFSAGAGQEALDRLSDDDRSRNSVYTRELAPLLATPGLDLVDIARAVRQKVRHSASFVNHRQMPAYYDETTGKFCPAGCAAPEKPLPRPPGPAEAWYLSIYRNVDFLEGDLGPGVSAASQDDCELACEAEPRCRLFSYVPTQRLCYLKASLGLPYRNTRVVSGFYRRSFTGLPPEEELDVEIEWELRFNTKLTFPTFRWRQAESIAVCAQLCRAVGCPAFTKHPNYSDNCELPFGFLDTPLGTETGPGAITGIPTFQRVPPAETRPVRNQLLIAR